jgi:hypothetical protein
MKVLSLLTLSAMLSISACSHMKPSCCNKSQEKTSCAKEDCKKACCDKDKKCSDGSCTTEKKSCADDHCKKKS